MFLQAGSKNVAANILKKCFGAKSSIQKVDLNNLSFHLIFINAESYPIISDSVPTIFSIMQNTSNATQTDFILNWIGYNCTSVRIRQQKHESGCAVAIKLHYQVNKKLQVSLCMTDLVLDL